MLGALGLWAMMMFAEPAILSFYASPEQQIHLQAAESFKALLTFESNGALRIADTGCATWDVVGKLCFDSVTIGRGVKGLICIEDDKGLKTCMKRWQWIAAADRAMMPDPE